MLIQNERKVQLHINVCSSRRRTVSEFKGTTKMFNIRSDYLMCCSIYFINRLNEILSFEEFVSIYVQNSVALYSFIL